MAPYAYANATAGRVQRNGSSRIKQEGPYQMDSDNVELENYHLQILGCIFNAGVIGRNYWPIQYISRKCKWTELAKENGIRKNLKKVLRYLESLGLVDLHGKSRSPVVSLTSEGVAVARDHLGI